MLPHILYVYISFKSLNERTSAISRLLLNRFDKVEIQNKRPPLLCKVDLKIEFVYDDERGFIQTDLFESVPYFVGTKFVQFRHSLYLGD
jgi:hypothetical protein